MKFKINNSEWEIKEEDKDTLLKTYKEQFDSEGYFVFGLTSYSQHKILLNKNMCKDQKIRTLKHELTHCFIYSYGMYNVPSFNEEMVCDLVASINDFINEIVNEFKEETKE